MFDPRPQFLAPALVETPSLPLASPPDAAAHYIHAAELLSDSVVEPAWLPPSPHGDEEEEFIGQDVVRKTFVVYSHNDGTMSMPEVAHRRPTKAADDAPPDAFEFCFEDRDVLINFFRLPNGDIAPRHVRSIRRYNISGTFATRLPKNER
jgi:hypothetical protein